jgi:hypothetical protein
VAALIANGAIPAAGANTTVSEATGSIRYVRATICNNDTVAHTFHVDAGAHRVKYAMPLAAGEDRIVGPYSLTAGETMVVTKIEADTTRACHVRFVGEVPN